MVTCLEFAFYIKSFVDILSLPDCCIYKVHDWRCKYLSLCSIQAVIERDLLRHPCMFLTPPFGQAQPQAQLQWG